MKNTGAKDKKILEEFLRESNEIEREFSKKAHEDTYKAWKFLEYFDELSLTRILECHKLLMTRLNKEIAGRIRNVDVRVGYHIMPSFEQVEMLLNRLLEFVPQTEEEIRQWHIQFEGIHPFEDGNGRTGRIIMNWHRVKNSLPLLVIHTGHEQDEYYTWFKTY